jgi:O-antigen/teichoic acid export membrane protein
MSRYFIAGYEGERALGIFAAIASVVTIGRTLLVAVEDPAVPRLAQHYARGQADDFRSLFGKLLGLDLLVGGGMLLLFALAGGTILTLLFTGEYAQDLPLALWLLGAGAVGYLATTCAVGLTTTRFFRLHLPVSVFVVAVSALTNWLLIPAYGLHGAALATLITVAVQASSYVAAVTYGLRRMPEPS